MQSYNLMHNATNTQRPLSAFRYMLYKSVGRFYKQRGHKNNYSQKEDPGNLKTFQCFPPLSQIMQGLENISALNMT